METLERQAAEFGVSREEELKRLVIHGILHLKGMDHASNDTNEEKMLQMQEQILFQLSGDTIF
jgi:probable rRNA maturation factor